MTVAVEPPPTLEPEAGVIEEARARQRRHRGVAAAATLAAATIAAILLAFAGGGRGSQPTGASVPRGHPPSQAARLSPAACYSHTSKALQGAPSKLLLSILGVLRRPATAADRIPRALAAQGAGSNAFVHFVRRTRVVRGSSYYIYPAILGCGGQAHQGMMHLDTNVDLGGGAIGATGSGGATAADIEQGQDAGTGPPGSSTSSTVTMIVPDGIAKVTLRYPAGRASGYSTKISPPFTITTTPIDNEVVVSVPRSAGGSAVHQVKMIWRAANGHVTRTFNRL
jgi:hypothetical protein